MGCAASHVTRDELVPTTPSSSGEVLCEEESAQEESAVEVAKQDTKGYNAFVEAFVSVVGVLVTRKDPDPGEGEWKELTQKVMKRRYGDDSYPASPATQVSRCSPRRLPTAAASRSCRSVDDTYQTAPRPQFPLTSISADAVKLMNAMGSPGTTAKVQGSCGHWDTDKFASELLCHSFLGAFLEPTSAYGATYCLDLSGRNMEFDRAAPRLQELKGSAIRTAPSSLLRCQGFVTSTRGAPELVRIAVFFHDGEVRTYSPSDGVSWGLAKVILHSLGAYLVGCIHTGVHLLSYAIIDAVQRVVPESCLLRQVLDPDTGFVARIELGDSHSVDGGADSLWHSRIWNVDVREVKDVCMDIARYFLSADLERALGLQLGEACPFPRWWAGGAAHFVSPITTFAKRLAHSVFHEAGSDMHIRKFQQELRSLGMISQNSQLFMSNLEEDLSSFCRNVMFVQSIVYSHMFATREYLTPLGLPHTERIGDLLKGSVTFRSTPEAIDKAYLLTVKELAPFIAWTSIIYGTSGGLDDAPELGEGPYCRYSNCMGRMCSDFRTELEDARKNIRDCFAADRGGFVPSYFFPTKVDTPSGYSINCI
eukprot:TRINITY_DN15991_c0_g1_i1.p1 TRINITY_DN15991_c0_g1~~TRINITY_DN15991_c0_g1_i1.p1  ORF type:complete len:593 (+),score=47.21 TRINITY_DN15991_c0_g1_i1:154-1932(+)